MRWRHRLLQLLLLLCLGLTLYVASIFPLQWDWSREGRNRLHPQTLALLQQLQAPLKVTAFVPDHPLQRAAITTLLDKYRQHHPRLALEFIDPSQQPELSRSLDIQHTPLLLLEYNGRQERVNTVNEQVLTEAITRLSLKVQGWIAGIQGHGEASLTGKRNFDLGRFGQLLEEKSYKIIDLDLSSTGQIPQNVQLLVLAAPATALTDNELAIIINYLEQGGALLWLADGKIPAPLADYFGIVFLPGIIVDAAAADLGMDSPAIAIGKMAQNAPLEKTLAAPVFLPHARVPEIMADKWKAAPLLLTGSRSWNETGKLQGNIARNPQFGEQRGPLNLALALQRSRTEGKEQKVVIVGDSDFLSNSFIGNGANRDFGLALIHWLTDNRQLIDIPEFTPADQQLHWTPATIAWVAAVFLFGIPVLLTATGLFIGWRRKKA
ncbi:GldG family protein [Thiolapillus sp.]